MRQVSAEYDYDGTLILDSRNFRGMTSTGKHHHHPPRSLSVTEFSIHSDAWRRPTAENASSLTWHARLHTHRGVGRFLLQLQRRSEGSQGGLRLPELLFHVGRAGRGGPRHPSTLPFLSPAFLVCESLNTQLQDMASLGGTPRSGPEPSIHVAKYDTSSDSERAFVSTIIGRNKVGTQSTHTKKADCGKYGSSGHTQSEISRITNPYPKQPLLCRVRQGGEGGQICFSPQRTLTSCKTY
jgi:hypothetical protein